jgi:hypothetical protein
MADSKSLFALVIKNSPDRTRDIRVKMWGTSPKLTGNLGNVVEALRFGARRLDFFHQENWRPEI